LRRNRLRWARRGPASTPNRRRPTRRRSIRSCCV